VTTWSKRYLTGSRPTPRRREGRKGGIREKRGRKEGARVPGLGASASLHTFTSVQFYVLLDYKRRRRGRKRRKKKKKRKRKNTTQQRMLLSTSLPRPAKKEGERG